MVPFFSIIIPTYNRAETICNAVMSIANQSFHSFEIIIVDDGSSDNTYSKLVELKKKKKLNLNYKKTVNMGPYFARKTGMSLANGKYILFLDSDDVFDKNALYLLYQNITRNKCVDIIYFLSDNEKFIKRLNLQKGSSRNLSEEEMFYYSFSIGGDYSPISYKCVNRKIINKAINFSLFDMRDFKYSEDIMQTLELLHFCKKGLVLNEVLYKYKNTKNSLSKNITAKQYSCSIITMLLIFQSISMKKYDLSMYERFLNGLYYQTFSYISLKNKEKKFKWKNDSTYRYFYSSLFYKYLAEPKNKKFFLKNKNFKTLIAVRLFISKKNNVLKALYFLKNLLNL